MEQLIYAYIDVKDDTKKIKKLKNFFRFFTKNA